MWISVAAHILHTANCPTITHEHFQHTVGTHTSYILTSPPHTNVLIYSHTQRTSSLPSLLISSTSPWTVGPLPLPFSPSLSPSSSRGLTCSIVWGRLLFPGRLWRRVLQPEGERQRDEKGKDLPSVSFTSLMSELQSHSRHISGRVTETDMGTETEWSDTTICLCEVNNPTVTVSYHFFWTIKNKVSQNWLKKAYSYNLTH